MDLKTAFIPEAREIEHLVSNAKGLYPSFAMGSAYASQSPTGKTSTDAYNNYCIRTKNFLDTLFLVQGSAAPLLFDSEWFSLYKMILCDEYFYARTHDDKGKIKFSTYFSDAELVKIFTSEEARNFILYKGLIRNDNDIDYKRISMSARVLYYADRLRFATETIQQISKLSVLPDNTRSLLNTLLEKFDRIHERCDILGIPFEDTIRNDIARCLTLPTADDKIAFIGHRTREQGSAPH